MPFVDIDKKKNETMDNAAQNQDQKMESAPVNSEDSVRTPEQNDEKLITHTNGVNEKVEDDGTRLISRPFDDSVTGSVAPAPTESESVSESMPEPESQTAIPPTAHMINEVEDNQAQIYPKLETVQEDSSPETMTPIDEKIEENEEVIKSEDGFTAPEPESPVKQPMQEAPKTESSNGLPPLPDLEEEGTKEAKIQAPIQNVTQSPTSAVDNVLDPTIPTTSTTDMPKVEDEDINVFLDEAIKRDASDVHFETGYPVYYRVDGALQRLGVDPMSKEKLEKILLPVLTEEHKKDLLEKEIEIDMVYKHASGNRFRVNMFKESGNVAAAFRLIPKKIRTIEELGLPNILKEFSKIPYGLVLLTGPTGSGKSTTIAAMIEEINSTEARHIITVEDPIEYVYDKKLSLIAQRSMFEDTRGWDKALRAVLRQDPNVVLIGEMRDYETIASALTIAETGHLVFATLHTNSAAQTIDRIIDVFPEGQQNQVRSQLGNMLSAVISQRLIPLKNGGRKAAMEVLIGNIAVKNAIREGKTHQIDNIIQTSADIGMFSLEKSLVDLVRAGHIDVDTAKNFSSKPDEIDLLLR